MILRGGTYGGGGSVSIRGVWVVGEVIMGETLAHPGVVLQRAGEKEEEREGWGKRKKNWVLTFSLKCLVHLPPQRTLFSVRSEDRSERSFDPFSSAG